LNQLADRLTEVGFHQDFGNLQDKAKRVSKLIKHIGPQMGVSGSVIQKAQEVAPFAKADLLTQMVREFPELQGIAGRFYAQLEGKDKELSQAIEEHYWPLTAEGPLPESNVAALVSLADKLDTVSANVYLGHAPTGSADPFALRRLSVGILRILSEKEWPVTLKWLATASTNFQEWYKQDIDNVRKETLAFLNQRCFNWFGHLGFRNDEIEAVFSSGETTLAAAKKKLKALKSVRDRPEFPALAAAIKRTQNILNQARKRGLLPTQNGNINEADLLEKTEKGLNQAIQTTTPNVKEALDKEDYATALLLLAPLKEPVDAFFEGVMVMVEDENVRSLRLRLLMGIEQLFGSMADFSKLQGTPSQPKT